MGLGDFISGIFGSKNEEADKVDPYKTDPNAYEYGGQPGGAQFASDQYGNQSNVFNNGSHWAFDQGGSAINNANAARGEQQQALALAKGRALGQNLISSQVTAQQQQQAAAQQAGLAASARGPAALAQAQQARAANTGQATAQLGAQGAISAAQEQLANQQAYAGQAAGIRAGDLGTVGAAGNLGAQQGQLGIGYSGLQNNVRQAQLTAQMNKQAQDSANYNAAHGIQAGAVGQNAQTNQQNAMSLIGAVAQGGGAALAAKGGAFHQDAPYLVGEEAPELVIPKKDGWVLDATQTAAVLGAPPTAQQLAHMTPEQRQKFAQMRRPQHESMALAHGGRARAAGGPLLTRDHAANGPPPGDPNAPQAQYQPGYGWFQPDAQKQQLVDEIASTMDQKAAQDEKDVGYEEMDRKIAALRESDNASEAKKIQASFASPKGGEKSARAGRFGAGLVSGIGSSFGDAAKHVDTGYHPPAAYQAPQLLALPARAFGGPMMHQTGGLDGMSAGELGMGGAGGLVSGTIGHENAIVSDAWKHPGGMGGYAREEGGSILANVAERGSRLVHHLAASLANATEPEAIAIERKAPRAAVTEKNDAYTTGTGWPAHASAPTTATLSRPGPKEYPEKVTRAKSDEDDKARACGGLMLAPGKRRRAA